MGLEVAQMGRLIVHALSRIIASSATAIRTLTLMTFRELFAILLDMNSGNTDATPKMRFWFLDKVDNKCRK
jgi:hypothetical protein